MRGGRESGHVGPDLGEDDLRRVGAYAWDLVEPFDRGEPGAFGEGGGVDPEARRRCAGVRIGIGVVLVTDRRGFGQRSDVFVDACGERVDLAAEGI